LSALKNKLKPASKNPKPDDPKPEGGADRFNQGQNN